MSGTDPLASALALTQVIDQSGRLVDGARPPDTATLLAGYRELVLARRFNEQAGALVRQGRLAVYPSSRGQEACQVACVQVLSPQDWLFPTYRDTAAICARGVDPVEVLDLLAGNWHCGFDPIEHRVAPQATPLATQLLHAVGVAHAARLKGEDTVAMALCGDGATSEGDFHEACNIAAVFAAPVVFFVQNNKYAISVPLARQSVAPSLAAKAVGYGMPGVRVDGNDLAALLLVLGEAVDRARRGDGPTLIEADTYRMEAHTNADDATRYRTDAEVTQWAAKDPLIRIRAFLSEAGVLGEAQEQEYAAAAETMAAHVRAGLNAQHPANPEELFAYVYAGPTPQLREQREVVRRELAFEESS